jgi:hypothetical protein
MGILFKEIAVCFYFIFLIFFGPFGEFRVIRLSSKFKGKVAARPRLADSHQSSSPPAGAGWRLLREIHVTGRAMTTFSVGPGAARFPPSPADKKDPCRSP